MRIWCVYAPVALIAKLSPQFYVNFYIFVDLNCEFSHRWLTTAFASSCEIIIFYHVLIMNLAIAPRIEKKASDFDARPFVNILVITNVQVTKNIGNSYQIEIDTNDPA